MFLRRAQADDTNSVIIRTFGEDHHIKAGINQPDGDEADFAVIEPVVFAFERGVPLKVCCGPLGNAVLGPVNIVLRRIILDLHLIYVHPLNGLCKCELLPAIALHPCHEIKAASVNLCGWHGQADQAGERWHDVDGLNRVGLFKGRCALPPEEDRHAAIIAPG
jgi:hypothetical protein